MLAYSFHTCYVVTKFILPTINALKFLTIILLWGTCHSKHKSKYSCKSAIYFDLGSDMIEKNCKFVFYYNKTDITYTVLDGANEIILVNWPDW